MKYCEECKKEYDTESKKCPVCGAELKDTAPDAIDTAATVATMTTLGIL